MSGRRLFLLLLVDRVDRATAPLTVAGLLKYYPWALLGGLAYLLAGTMPRPGRLPLAAPGPIADHRP